MHVILNVSPDLVTSESKFLQWVLGWIANRHSNCDRVSVHFFQPRTQEGWCEALVVLDSNELGEFVPGQSMTVCAIQRTPDGGMEFHS
jgi:hypothetical protein